MVYIPFPGIWHSVWRRLASANHSPCVSVSGLVQAFDVRWELIPGCVGLQLLKGVQAAAALRRHSYDVDLFSKTSQSPCDFLLPLSNLYNARTSTCRRKPTILHNIRCRRRFPHSSSPSSSLRAMYRGTHSPYRYFAFSSNTPRQILLPSASYSTSELTPTFLYTHRKSERRSMGPMVYSALTPVHLTV